MNKLERIYEASKMLRKHEPGLISTAGIYGTMASITVYTRKSPMVYWSLYKATGEDKYLVKFYQITKTNNWLKMHGYPMRRKSH